MKFTILSVLVRQKAPWMLVTCWSRCWPVVNCIWSVPRHWTSTGKTSRKIKPLSVGSNGCWFRNLVLKIRSVFCGVWRNDSKFFIKFGSMIPRWSLQLLCPIGISQIDFCLTRRLIWWTRLVPQLTWKWTPARLSWMWQSANRCSWKLNSKHWRMKLILPARSD